eukprot:CAMPEP_0206577610 /NCGR_PEP_ID=MMETSP0325_2-20121206/31465_1 /ASSEMBLY_ACC=CAM_ASM_000347 /TAXON_ID=2866 /ORGANISM="Crypthecodinium cohnii, Strain Seligo" /LENGTH=71 /DNA_ID=CAMNT_0054083081 /DNA_START=816 /DNA_END=1032 /DNA_ORIENTATION=-
MKEGQAWATALLEKLRCIEAARVEGVEGDRPQELERGRSGLLSLDSFFYRGADLENQAASFPFFALGVAMF